MLHFSHGKDSLFINNVCSEIKLNGTIHSVSHTDLFTKEKGRIFTEIYEIKYSKGMCYVYEICEYKTKKLILSLESGNNTQGLSQNKSMTRDVDKEFFQTMSSFSIDKNTRRFFISKFLPHIILEESVNSDIPFIIIKSDTETEHIVSKKQPYKLKKDITVYESDDNKCVLSVSSNAKIPSTYNGIYISEII